MTIFANVRNIAIGQLNYHCNLKSADNRWSKFSSKLVKLINSSRAEKTSCFTAVINHMRPSAQKRSRQNQRFGGCQSTPPACRLYALVCKIYLKNEEKPCSGPFIKIIILLLTCKALASSLTIHP